MEKKQTTLLEIFGHGCRLCTLYFIVREDPSIINDQKPRVYSFLWSYLILVDWLPDFLVSICVKRLLIFPDLKIDGNYLT